MERHALATNYNIPDRSRYIRRHVGAEQSQQPAVVKDESKAAKRANRPVVRAALSSENLDKIASDLIATA